MRALSSGEKEEQTQEQRQGTVLGPLGHAAGAQAFPRRPSAAPVAADPGLRRGLQAWLPRPCSPARTSCSV